MTDQPSIPRRTLGGTGLEVSVLGYGASPLGGVFHEIDEGEAIASVHEAFNLGINIFDTSPFYGTTKSETVLGKALVGLPRDRIIVATKVGRYGADDFDFSAERVTRCFRESLVRLQLDFVDIVQCHDIEFGDLHQVVNETLPALAALKAEGLVRHIGITGLPLSVFPTVLRLAPPASVDICLSYCHYCLNDRTLEALLPNLEEHAVGIINASCLCMGLLTAGGPPAWHPAPAAVKQAAADAAAAVQAQGQDISELALMWALKEPRIATTLVGMPTRDLVRTNVQCALRALGVEENAGAEAQAAALRDAERLLQPVRDMTWPSGRPENN